MAALLAIVACAPQRTAPAPAAEEGRPAVDVGYGTIISIRPVARRADNTGVATIMLAIGSAAESLPARGHPVELIVHEDFAPAPISVVQSDADDLRPGDRVVIARGARTRLARGGPPAPSGS
jgi:outer membrane lipoprotein SlyB